MDQNDNRALEILSELGSRPAAPFFEDGPAQYIIETISALGIEAKRDQFGNVIAHYQNNPPQGQPPIAFVAHMDHPGYEIIEVTEGGFFACALGGVPAASQKKIVPALIIAPDGERIPVQITPIENPTDEQKADRQVIVRVESEIDLDLPAPVVFDLPDFSLDGDIIRMRAADDLAGCAGTIAALEKLVADDIEADLYAVFTRAEEGGLFGARLMAEAGTLPKDTLVVSIESSPVIPGVAQGDGPVIRTGDRMYTFDADAEQAFVVASAALSEQDSEFKFQRQLMSGGSCEATAFAVFGYKVTGMAFPLGNWHNATTTIPDPDGDVDSEYIHLNDFLNGGKLLTEAAKSVSKRDSSRSRDYVRNIPDDIRERMSNTSRS